MRLLVIDAGNSNIVLGLYDNDKLAHQWRIYTDRNKLADEYAALIDALLLKDGIKRESIDAVAFSNVVPTMQGLFEELGKNYFKKEAFFINYRNKMNMTIKLDNPSEMGADLIAGSVAAIEKFGTPLVIADFGTATTIVAINSKSEYLGGVIAPGMALISNALYSHAPHLPRIELKKPPKPYGTNTIHAMQAGIFSGYIYMMEGLINNVKNAAGADAKIIATGGLAEVFKNGSEIFEIVEHTLVLEGIKILYNMNS